MGNLEMVEETKIKEDFLNEVAWNVYGKQYNELDEQTKRAVEFEADGRLNYFCPKCGQHLVVHGTDGSCVKD